MSLSSRLADPRVRTALKGLISNPGLQEQPILVERIAESPQRVGTAFDYVLRFGLANRYPATERETVAEVAAGMGHVWGKSRQEVAGDLEIVAGAIETASAGTVGPRLDPKAAVAALVLAGYTDVYRSKRPEAAEVSPTPEESEELVELFDIVPWSVFEPRRQLYLNPHFGRGSLAVEGADADLVLDGVLIDVKTISKDRVNLGMIRQVVCYALLANRFGLNEEEAPAGITKIGFYLSRSGCLLSTGLAECIDPAHHDLVLDVLLENDPPLGASI